MPKVPRPGLILGHSLHGGTIFFQPDKSAYADPSTEDDLVEEVEESPSEEDDLVVVHPTGIPCFDEGAEDERQLGDCSTAFAGDEEAMEMCWPTLTCRNGGSVSAGH